MIVRCFRDDAAVAEAAAEHIANAAARTISDRRIFRIALAGGGTPKLAYGRLAQRRDVDWSSVDIFFGDERCVAPDDDASNFKMANEALLSHVSIAAERVHRIQGELGPREAARRYEIELGQQPLHLVLLGMGTDGHTASLFPGDMVGGEHRVVAAKGPPPHVERVTLSFRALREAEALLFLVTGAAKAEMLAKVIREAASEGAYLPAAKASARDSAHWFVDTAAAAQLPPSVLSK